MVETTQTPRAKDEVLLGGTIGEDNFTAFLRAYNNNIPDVVPPDEPVLMLLEEQPRRVVKQHERQDLLHFAFYDPGFDFASYTSGRIFHAQGELRWERQHSKVQIVYTGHKKYKPELPNARCSKLDNYEPKERRYFLFGKRLNEKELARIGSAAKAGDFAELRIPRLLRYPQLPSLANEERIQLVICEYIDPDTALNVAYRFKGLGKPLEETTGAK